MAWCGGKRRARRGRGQAMVEFSLILPFFMVLMLAMLQWSHMFYVHQTLQNAVREAGRYGTTGRTNFGGASWSSVETAVLQLLYSNSVGLLPSQKARIYFNDTDVTNAAASLGGPTAVFNIRVEYKYDYHLPLVGFFNAYFGSGKFNDHSNLVVNATFQAEKWDENFL